MERSHSTLLFPMVQIWPCPPHVFPRGEIWAHLAHKSGTLPDLCASLFRPDGVAVTIISPIWCICWTHWTRHLARRKRNRECLLEGLGKVARDMSCAPGLSCHLYAAGDGFNFHYGGPSSSSPAGCICIRELTWLRPANPSMPCSSGFTCSAVGPLPEKSKLLRE